MIEKSDFCKKQELLSDPNIERKIFLFKEQFPTNYLYLLKCLNADVKEDFSCVNVFFCKNSLKILNLSYFKKIEIFLKLKEYRIKIFVKQIISLVQNFNREKSGKCIFNPAHFYQQDCLGEFFNRLYQFKIDLQKKSNEDLCNTFCEEIIIITVEGIVFNIEKLSFFDLIYEFVNNFTIIFLQISNARFNKEFSLKLVTILNSMKKLRSINFINVETSVLEFNLLKIDKFIEFKCCIYTEI